MSVASLPGFARCSAIPETGVHLMKKYLPLAALLASVSAVPASAQIMDSQTYRTMASQADAFEIASSQLALERSRNPVVRRYAENMIRDHGMTSQALNG